MQEIIKTKRHLATELRNCINYINVAQELGFNLSSAQHYYEVKARCIEHKLNTLTYRFSQK